jgi:hypothetical protein
MAGDGSGTLQEMLSQCLRSITRPASRLQL